MQNREYETVEWTVQTFDILLALIGGFVGLIWDTIAFTVNGYESFKFGTNLISEIYSITAKSRMEISNLPND